MSHPVVVKALRALRAEEQPASTPSSLPSRQRQALLAELFDRNLAEHRRTIDLLAAQRDEVCLAGARLARTLRDGGRLLLFGNGGSACDAMHIAAELSGRLKQERRALPALCLNSDVAALTAIANDYGYAEVFARLLVAHARRGDCAIALSTSGASANVLRGLACARTLGVRSIALLGRDGGAARGLADQALVIAHDDSARVQEAHILVGHTWCGQIETALGLVG